MSDDELARENQRLRELVASLRALVREQAQRMQELMDEQTRRAGSVGALASELEDLAHELTVTRNAAEQATRAKASFLATMSHEIRTPMNAVIGMTGVLLETQLADDQRECALTIKTSGELLLGIIDDILDYSKIEAGGLELEHVAFDPVKCITEAMEILAFKASQKNLSVGHLVRPDVPRSIVGDPGRVRQILVNLIGNAVKFTETGEILAKVELDKGDKFLHFSVRDTGPGIPADRMARLFQPFTQVDASTTRVHGGTGLGLSICRSLATAMGGKAWVESEPGHGSTFHFTIRAERATTPNKARPSRLFRIPSASDSPPTTGALDVLLVEDNPVNRRVFEMMTARLGHRTKMAPNGYEALVILTKHHFDIIFMDVHMPEMNGFETTRRIRALEAGAGAPRTRIIGLSAAALAEDRAQGFAAGMDEYLTKPLGMAPLTEAFERAAQMRTQAPQPAAPPPASFSTGNLQGDVIDKSSIEALVSALGTESFRIILQDFLQDAPRRIEAMKRASDAGITQDAVKEAHSLKSTSATFGAAKLSSLCGEVEDAGSKPEEVARLVTQALTTWAQAEVALRSLFGS